MLVLLFPELYKEGEDVTKLVSMCKLKGGRLVREVSDSCLQFWGGMGFTKEVIVSRFYRDMRLVSIGGGADEVMLSIICKYLGILPKLGKKKH
ncbi:putative acyl-CoA dehydrogenase 6 [Portunus trituberculatus]|uniref:Putative acyl-CoA dehydrogenase 6 n=1 Tax=Portunus trituberculatus TaxID=210409 RepID=A0A5B7CPM8_PORTR|nr:putative acyl-CoA dehydrogenase 6 [Portunus trituberculatus]